jgi:hypothetical protein
MANQNLITQSNWVFLSSMPSAPGNGATVILFSTYRKQAGGSGAYLQPSTFVRACSQEALTVAPGAIEQVRVAFHKHDKASAANGLRAYVLDPQGSWVETDLKDPTSGSATIGANATVQVPALTAPQEFVKTFSLAGYIGFALEYTAGAAGPTADTGWDLTVAAKLAQQPAQ